jgi:hypothetical protein
MLAERVTEVAEFVGRTRQNIRKLLLTCAAYTPAPVHEGNPSLWHLADLLVWLKDQKSYSIQTDLMDLAWTNKQVNIAASQYNADSSMQEAVRVLLV